MNCPNCNAQMRDQARFCPSCGTAAGGSPPAALPPMGAPPPPVAVGMPGPMPGPMNLLRPDLVAVAQRDLRRINLAVLPRLDQALRADEQVDALAMCDPDGAVLAATDQRLLVVAPQSPDIVGPSYDTLRDIVVLPFGRRVLVCPLVAGVPFEARVVGRDPGVAIAGFARQRLTPMLEASAGEEWYDDPAFTVAARFDNAALVLAPEGAPIPGRTAVIVSIVTTGVQLTAVGQASGQVTPRVFLPWSELLGAALETPEQAAARQGYTVATELGLPGSTARAPDQQAIFAVTIDSGAYVLLLRGSRIADTAMALAPVFSRMPGATTPLSPTGGSSAAGGVNDPMAQIRKLAQLKDEGLLSEAEFEEKKADLLKRI